MNKLFLFSILTFLLISSPPMIYGESNCQQGYPHVAKKDGTYDTRKNDLWELAQDWVFYRNRILKCNNQGNQKCVAKAQRSFKDVNNWLSAYSEDHQYKAFELAEDCRK